MLILSTNGVDVSVAHAGGNTAQLGVTLTADISGPLLRVLYTSTNTGSVGELKFNIRRWSNSPGGPSGVPSYSGGTSSGGVTSSGSPSINQLAIFTSPSDITGNGNLTFNSVDSVLNIDDLSIVGLKPVTLNDNVSTATTAIIFNTTISSFFVVEYSMERGSERSMGMFFLTHNGIEAKMSNMGIDTPPIGISLSAELNGTNIELKYTSTSTGINTDMKFSVRRWL